MWILSKWLKRRRDKKAYDRAVENRRYKFVEELTYEVDLIKCKKSTLSSSQRKQTLEVYAELKKEKGEV